MSDARAVSFGAVSGAYDAARPSYPDPSVRWLLTGPASPVHLGPVVDVGAGTGKLTRSIAALGHDVIAVDPDPAMLAILRGHSPDVAAHVGRGEEIPLDDGTVGGVVFGQSWHWVDVAAASAEAARVLRPGGFLGLIWNIRDESVDWIRTLGEIMHNSVAEALISSERGPEVGAPFEGLAQHEHRWSRAIDRARLMQLVESRSYVITASDGERRSILAGVGELLDTLPALADGGTIAMDYVTHSYRTLSPARG